MRWTCVFLLLTRLTSSWKSRILITDLNNSKINMIILHLLLLFSCSRRRCMVDGYKLYLVKWIFSQSSMSKKSKVIIDVKDQYCCIQLCKVSRSIQYLGHKYLRLFQLIKVLNNHSTIINHDIRCLPIWKISGTKLITIPDKATFASSYLYSNWVYILQRSIAKV